MSDHPEPDRRRPRKRLLAVVLALGLVLITTLVVALVWRGNTTRHATAVASTTSTASADVQVALPSHTPSVPALASSSTIGTTTPAGSPSGATQPGTSPATPQCTNSDGTPCPASYFTGPLGKNNVVPRGTGALLMDRYGGQGTSWAQAQQGLLAREKAMGRMFDSFQFQTNAEDPTATRGQEQWLIDHGYEFLTIAWTPTYDIPAINRGDYDALYVKAAQYWKQFAPTRIMLRTLGEFNLKQDLVANSYGQPFQQAWQRMVNIFARHGASNVGFWYNPDEGNNRQCIIDSYPGDRYVDWVGSDSYNWCKVGDNSCYSTPIHAGPATFGELFNYSPGQCPNGACPKSQHEIFGPRKPFVIGETGTIYDKDNTSFKPQFLNSVAPGAKSMKYLRGIAFFDCDVTAVEGPLTNFRVDAPTNEPQHLAAFVNLSHDPWFNVWWR